MKKIDGQKLYDTETAVKLFHWDNGHFPANERYEQEDLYITEDGEYFLYVTGGSLTENALPFKKGKFSGSSDIIPLTNSRAAVWAERHCYKLFDQENKD